MGTTLALNGAYNLAGAIARHPEDLPTAFDEYENHMRPLVDRAQKLFPGMPHLLHPETAWGVWMTNAFGYALIWSGIAKLLFKLKGPPADAEPVEEYGFRQLQEAPIQSQ